SLKRDLASAPSRPGGRPSAWAAPGSLHVQMADVQGVFLDEFAARLDDVAHQRGEDGVRLIRMADADLEQRARLGVERGLPELFGVHLAQPLIALDGDALAAMLHDVLDQGDWAVDRGALRLAAGVGAQD